MSVSSKRLSEIVNAQSEILRIREAVTEQETLKRYEQAATRIEAETNRTLNQVERLRASGEPLDAAMFRLNRYQSLQQQIDLEIQKVTGPVLRQVQTNQAFAAGLAQQTAFQTTHALLDSESPDRVSTTGVMSDWTRLPKDALDDLIGYMSNGKPLMNMLQNISSATAEHATRILTEGLAIGKNPRVVAREMRQSTGMAANRALTISRTEMLRSYRESTRRAFTANAFETGGTIKGWVWHCALDSRCCCACVSMHGQVFNVEEKLNGHPNCRCTMVPKTASWEELGFTNIPDTNPVIEEGSEWFNKQPESVQKAILGPGKLNLYRGNRITLADTVIIKVNPVWGSVRTEASITESLQNARIRRAFDPL